MESKERPIKFRGGPKDGQRGATLGGRYPDTIGASGQDDETFVYVATDEWEGDARIYVLTGRPHSN